MKNAPPLLSLMDGRRVRARRSACERPREVGLHLAVADTLRKHCLPSWLWTHFPAGEARDVRTGAKLKRMGLQRGWPDFILLRPARGASRGQIYALELKRVGEDLTEDQAEFAAWCEANLVPFAVAHTVDEALAILSDWRCLRIRVAGAISRATGVTL